MENGCVHARKVAGWVCVYHALVIIAALTLVAFICAPDVLTQGIESEPNSEEEAVTNIFHSNPTGLISFGFLCGTLGGTLVASRYVVRALRLNTYDKNRLAWQLLTPLHGGALAVVGVFVVGGGILSLVQNPQPSANAGWLMGGFAFLVGFSAETFVKALTRAARNLFNDDDNVSRRQESESEAGKSESEEEESEREEGNLESEAGEPKRGD